MTAPFRTTRRVEFADTDMAGIVHFSAFFRFMESAEHEFLRARGLSVVLDWDGEHLGFPRVAASSVCYPCRRVARAGGASRPRAGLGGRLNPRSGVGPMSAMFRCSRGHEWQDHFDDAPSLVDGGLYCPVCGVSSSAGLLPVG